MGGFAGARKHITLFIAAVLIAALPGCLSFDRSSDPERRISETAIQSEVAELIKLYRLCLQKYEDHPMKAKENCGVYKEAIRDLSPDHQKSIVAELLDRLRDKPH